MPNRAARRHPPSEEPPARRIIVPSGQWFEMGEMTGMDYLFLRDLQGRELVNEDFDKVLALLGRRVTASSAPVPLDRPISELLELLRRWFTDMGDDALPPPIATGSNGRSPSPHSTPNRAPRSRTVTP